MSKQKIKIIASIAIGIILFIGAVLSVIPEEKPIIKDSVALAAPVTLPQPASPVEHEQETVTANPTNNSSAANSYATYIVCAPLITTAASHVQATSSLQVASQALGQVRNIPELSQSIGSSQPGQGNNTHTVIPDSQPPVVPDPEQPPSSNQSSYLCTQDSYNCSDFSSQQEAQAAFEACGGIQNDVHKLDRDKDGRVCVSL